MNEPELLVIGGASLDVLHLPDGARIEAAGGAGLYTALGAAQAGARVTLLAPRPEPWPEALRPAAKRINWIGPVIAPADLMRLEIAHHGGGRATLVSAHWGALAALSPGDLPAGLTRYAAGHVAALGIAERQVEFLRAARARGARWLSAGTYARAVQAEPEAVRALWAQAQAFFLNENEAQGLFGSAAEAPAPPAGVLFLTLAERGAWVVSHARRTLIPATPVVEVDPTGAGDVFCGAVLAGLMRGLTPENAARAAMPLAARQVRALGPAALLEPSP